MRPSLELEPVSTHQRPAKRGANMRPHIPAAPTLPPASPPLDPIPPGVLVISMAHACDVCHKKWDVGATREVGGQIVADEFKVFLASRAVIPVIRRINDRGRECWDIWPLATPEECRGKGSCGRLVIKIVNRWICPACWPAVETYGRDHWLWECMDWEDRESAEDYAERMAIGDAVDLYAEPPTIGEMMGRVDAGASFVEMALEPDDEESLRREAGLPPES